MKARWHWSYETGCTPDAPWWALLSATLSPVLLAAGWLIGDALQPSGYDPVRQTVSVLSGYGGSYRWIMTGALLAVGCCHFVTAAGLRCVRVSARIVLAVAGLSALGIAACPEPVHGSTSAHLAWTALGATTIAVWPAFAGTPRWCRSGALNLRATAVVTAAFLALLGWLIAETRGGGYLGVAERLTPGVQTVWPLVVVLAARRIGRTAERGEQVSPAVAPALLEPERELAAVDQFVSNVA